MAETGSAQLKRELTNTVEALRATRAGSTGVEDRVTRVQQQVAAAGYPGVADNLKQVINQLHEVGARSDALADEVDGLGAHTMAVTSESTPSQVIAVLTPVNAGIDRAFTGANGVLDALDHTQRLIAHCLEGGSPKDLIGAVEQLKGTARDVNRSLAQAQKATEQAIAKARRSGKH
jgi:ABC-type transporter Mla subunit MlaD